MTTLTPPPVPAKLREMLKEYPDCIERLQDALNKYIGDPSYRDPYRGAILALQNMLGTLSTESNDELAAARASGDTRIIDSASKKYHSLFTAGWFVFEMVDMDDLWDYFQVNKEVFG